MESTKEQKNQQVDEQEVQQTDQQTNEQSMVKFEDGNLTINVGSMKEKTAQTAGSFVDKTKSGWKKASAFVKGKAKEVRKTKVSKKTVTMLIVLQLILAGVIAGSVYAASRAGYRGVLSEICSTVNRRDSRLDAVAGALLPDFAYTEYEYMMERLEDSEYAVDMVDNAEEQIDDLYLRLDDNFGANALISYKVIEQEKMSSSQLRRAERNCTDYYETYLKDFAEKVEESDYDTVKSIAGWFDIDTAQMREVFDSILVLKDNLENPVVSKGYNLKLQISIKGSKDEYTEKVNVSIIRVNGDWMIDYTSVDELNSVFRSLGREISDLYWFY
ncbi:MAG: hypothetical protein ACI4ED_05210 [Suilimivivens sp.]